MSYHRSVVTDPVSLAQRHHPAAGVLLPQAIEFLFIAMGNRRVFFDEVRHLLKFEYFTDEENIFAHVWVVMCGLADTISGPFVYETLCLAFRTYMREQQDVIMTPDSERELFTPAPGGFFWNMTKSECTNPHVEYARQILQHFLVERTVVHPLRKFVSGQSYPGNIGDLVRIVGDQASRITRMNELPVVPVSPQRGSTLYTPVVAYKSTGVAFIDRSLGGGQVDGDVIGLIGATGSGKTMLAIQIAVEGARQCWVDAGHGDQTPEFVTYISVEEQGLKLRPRIWSAAFSIKLSKLRTMASWDGLTTTANLDDYERHGLMTRANRGGEAPRMEVSSESDRYDAEQGMLERCFALLDFSGVGEYQTAGRGYIDEVISALDRVQQLRGQSLRTVVVDYAGLLVERFVGLADDREIRFWLNRVGDEFRMRVATRFNCTVWLLHQLRGAAGDASPLKLMTHHDAAETKDFANNLAVCCCLGVADPTTGCRRLNWSKTRNTRNESVPPVTLRIHDHFAIMEDVGDRFTIDAPSRRFISREQLEEYGGTPIPAPSVVRGRPAVGGATPSGAAAMQAHGGICYSIERTV
jgi:hypothetical protein